MVEAAGQEGTRSTIHKANSREREILRPNRERKQPRSYALCLWPRASREESGEWREAGALLPARSTTSLVEREGKLAHQLLSDSITNFLVSCFVCLFF